MLIPKLTRRGNIRGVFFVTLLKGIIQAMNEQPELVYLEGHISVLSAVQGGMREIHRIFIANERMDRETGRIEEAALASRIPVSRISGTELAGLCGSSKSGGVIAEVGEHAHAEIGALMNSTREGWIAALDGVEDPFNFGGALRALYAAGASGVVVGSRSWYTAAAVVGRSSAGASELMPSAVFSSHRKLVELARENKMLLAVGAETEGSVSIFDADLSGSILLVVGGERRGVSRSILKAADVILRIPYARSGFASLGTVAATSIMAFEIQRQRSLAGEQFPSSPIMQRPKPAYPSQLTRLNRRPLPDF